MSRPSPTPRFYQSESDLQQMQALLMEARSRSTDWRYPHVGELMWGFFMVACHLTPHQHIRLWHAGDGKLVGYAMLGEDPSFDCQVLPEVEGFGIETEAMAWADALLTELRRRNPQQWGPHLVATARQDDGGRRRFLKQHRFHPTEHCELNLLRSLAGPIPAPTLPTGCQVRAVAGASEIPNRASAQREVWRPWTVGDVRDEDYAWLMGLPGYERKLDLVAVAPDGVMAAYVNGWLDPLNKIGDFGPVGTRPGYRQQGFARAVLLEGLRRMQAYGMDRVCVSTGESNLPALRLYQSVGFEIQNRVLEYRRAEESH